MHVLPSKSLSIQITQESCQNAGSGSARVGWNLRFYVSNRLLSNVSASGPQITLRVATFWASALQSVTHWTVLVHKLKSKERNTQIASTHLETFRAV